MSHQQKAFEEARRLRAEGRHAEADEVMLAEERRLIEAATRLGRFEHKKTRADQTKEEVAAIDPEVDCALGGPFAGCKSHTNFFAIAVKFAHLDQGPAPKGEVSTGAMYFARVTPEQAEAKFVGRMNMIHHWEARAWNAFQWSMLVASLGLADARRRKASVKWIPLRRYDHLMAIAEGLTKEDASWQEPVQRALNQVEWASSHPATADRTKATGDDITTTAPSKSLAAFLTGDATDTPETNGAPDTADEANGAEANGPAGTGDEAMTGEEAQ